MKLLSSAIEDFDELQWIFWGPHLLPPICSFCQQNFNCISWLEQIRFDPIWSDFKVSAFVDLYVNLRLLQWSSPTIHLKIMPQISNCVVWLPIYISIKKCMYIAGYSSKLGYQRDCKIAHVEVNHSEPQPLGFVFRRGSALMLAMMGISRYTPKEIYIYTSNIYVYTITLNPEMEWMRRFLILLTDVFQVSRWCLVLKTRKPDLVPPHPASFRMTSHDRHVWSCLQRVGCSGVAESQELQCQEKTTKRYNNKNNNNNNNKQQQQQQQQGELPALSWNSVRCPVQISPLSRFAPSSRQSAAFACHSEDSKQWALTWDEIQLLLVF